VSWIHLPVAESASDGAEVDPGGDKLGCRVVPEGVQSGAAELELQREPAVLLAD